MIPRASDAKPLPSPRLCLAVGLLFGLVVLGCTSPAGPIVALGNLGDEHLAHAGGPSLVAHVQAGSAASGYRTQYVEVLDWEQADATLSNPSDTSVATATAIASATVNPDETRQATLSFTPIKPEAGYTLNVSLLRRDAGGTYQTVASGSNSNMTLANGQNSLSVTLSPTSKGQLIVSVPQPVIQVPPSPTPTPAPTPAPPAGVVTTLAGSGSLGESNGTASSATFFQPEGLNAASDGKLYIGDFGGNTIRTINPALPASSTSYVGTLLSSAGSGLTDGAAGTAQMSHPSCVWVDASGNVYFTDVNNNVVRKINQSAGPSSASFVTTVAGTGYSGLTDGAATSARFSAPRGLVGDGAGHLYVADSNNNAIRKIDLTVSPGSASYVTTIAGGSGYPGTTDGTGASARFSYPLGIAYDGSGNLYVSDYGSNRVRMVTTAGVVTTLAGATGGYQDGSAANARFNGPVYLSYANGMLFLADAGNNCIRMINLGLANTNLNFVTTIAGSPSGGYLDGTGTMAEFASPTQAVEDLVASHTLYVADRNNQRIRKIQF